MMLIYTDCASTAEASRIGRVLVREGLAACASWWRVSSVYRWQGHLREQGEAALLIKTSTSRQAKAVRRLRALHSYQVPAVITWRGTSANRAFTRWLSQAVNGDGRPGDTRSRAASRRSLALRRRVPA